MKSTDNANTALIVKAYHENYQRVLNFIASRVNCVEDAENLAQDVWVRLLSYTKPLEADTLLPMIFVIARNLINDFLRRLCRQRAYADDRLQEEDDSCEFTPEAQFSYRQIAEMENDRVKCLPQQRRIIYVMSRYEEKSPEEIALSLSLSKRTVENHLRLGRRDVRNYIAAVV